MLFPNYTFLRTDIRRRSLETPASKLRDKVVGMIIGGAIGDGLGMPVETWTPQQIYSTHSPNGITRYSPPFRHKYFWGRLDAEEDREGKTFMEEGTTTDDTALTVAIAEAIIEKKNIAFDGGDLHELLDAVALGHVRAVERSPVGYGKTTLEAIERIAQGVHWSESAKTDVPNRGYGNGGPMKVSPMAALSVARFKQGEIAETEFCGFDRARKVSAMTHGSRVSAEATMIHHFCLMYLLTVSDHQFSRGEMLHVVDGALQYFENNPKVFEGLSESFSMKAPFKRLTQCSTSGELSKASVDKLRDYFGNGDCQVLNSLPFSYAFFLRDPFNFQSILNVVNAGGDTDSNGYFVGSMLGALHGYSYFLRHENWWALNGLRNHVEVLNVANKLCDALGLGE